jgi:excisionase family DNA binding protein
MPKAQARQERQESGEDLWDRERTAKYLDLPPATLDVWVSRSKGPRFYKVGRHRRYDPADVRAWLEQQASAPRQRPASA